MQFLKREEIPSPHVFEHSDQELQIFQSQSNRRDKKKVKEKHYFGFCLLKKIISYNSERSEAGKKNRGGGNQFPHPIKSPPTNKAMGRSPGERSELIR